MKVWLIMVTLSFDPAVEAKVIAFSTLHSCTVVMQQIRHSVNSMVSEQQKQKYSDDFSGDWVFPNPNFDVICIGITKAGVVMEIGR